MSINRPTINDVARQAKVSKTTVSHVLSGKRIVTDHTKLRVLQAVEELDYRPSIAAQSLTTKRTATIGMIVSDATNVFFGDVLRGVEDVLRSANFNLIVCNTDEILEWEAHFLGLLLAQRVQGIIAAATSQRWPELLKAEASGTPVVLVDRTFDGATTPFVGVDNRRGAYEGTKHLIAAGHRRIGIIAGFERLSTMRERLAGFRQALAEHDIPLPDEWVVPSPLSAYDGRQATHKIMSLPERPSALFVSNNLLVLGAMMALQDLGLRCPQDLSVLAFDDHPWAAITNPPLSVVRQPSRRVGEVAAQTLLTLLNGQQLTNRHVILQCEVILRQSCCLGHTV